MLYIIDIDNSTFGMSGTGALAADVEVSYPKNFHAMSTNSVESATNGLVSVIDDDKCCRLISSVSPGDITLDGIIYSDANDFVKAFNTMMTGGDTVTAIVDFTDVTDKLQEVINCVCRDCNGWSIGDVESDSYTIDGGTVNSCTIIVESGTVNVSNGTNDADLVIGQSITIDGSWALEQDIIIDASSGKAIYVVTSCAVVTTTTVAPTTTTTTVAPTTTTTTPIV